MVWDVTLGYMHIIKNFIVRTLKFLKGERCPKLPKPPGSKSGSAEENKTKERFFYLFFYLLFYLFFYMLFYL